MTIKEAKNLKETKKEITIFGEGNSSNYSTNLPTEIRDWGEANKEPYPASSYVVSYQNKFGLLVSFPYTNEFCESNSSRHAHISRLANAATQNFYIKDVVFFYGHNTGKESQDEFVVFIPYGTLAKDLLTEIKTLMKQLDSDFIEAKKATEEMRSAFTTLRLI